MTTSFPSIDETITGHASGHDLSSTRYGAATSAVDGAAKDGADVTVVISTFNRAKYLREAIESILAQSVRPRRIVVVDDGSTDNTADLVAGFLDKVEYVRMENGGKARALNFALQTITTRYVWFFDDDDAAYPDALRNLLRPFHDEPSLGFSFGSYSKARTEDRLLSAESHAVPYQYSNLPQEEQKLRLFRNCSIMMSGSLISTDAIRRVGGLNARLIRSQDYDLMVRLAAAFSFSYCNSSVYVLRDHDGERGNQQSRHAHTDRLKKWAIYNQEIGYFLRYSVPAIIFSPSSHPNPQEEILRKTLLTRAWVLSPKLPSQYIVTDILEGFSVSPSEKISHKEIELLSEMFNDDAFPYHASIKLIKLVKLTATPAGCTALRFLAKGIYWQAIKQAPSMSRFALMTLAGIFALSSIRLK